VLLEAEDGFSPLVSFFLPFFTVTAQSDAVERQRGPTQVVIGEARVKTTD